MSRPNLPVLVFTVAALFWPLARRTTLVPATVEAPLGHAILLGFTAAILAAAWTLRQRPASPHATLIAAPVLFVFGLALSGALRIGTATPWHGVAATEGYGPLTAWPALQASWPAAHLVIHVTLGHALLLAATSLLVAWTLQHLWARRLTHTRSLRPAIGVAPLALVPSACAFCIPLWTSLVAGATPLALAPADPTRPLGVLLVLVAPLAALAALAYAARPPACATRRCTTPRLTRPLVTLGLLVLAITPEAMALAGMPRGDSARQDAIYGLMVLAVIVGSILVALVFALVGWFSYRYRARDGNPRHDWPIGGAARKTLVASFFVVPIIAVFGVGAVSYGVLFDMEQEPEPDMEIQVHATQFAWQFTYPDEEVRINELHVIQGAVVRLELTSADVIHSLFIPDLGVKMDAMPGTTTDTWFQARNTGSFPAYCAEWCGSGHPAMQATVTAHPPGTSLPPE